MKTFFTLSALLFTSLVFSQTYTTQASGNWNSASTWVGGRVPDANVSSSERVNIHHTVIYNLSSDLFINGGSVNVLGGTLQFPIGAGKNIYVRPGGLLSVVNGTLRQPIRPSGNGNIVGEGGRMYFVGSYVEVAQNFSSQKNGSRYIENTCMLVGENYENIEATDTISNSCIEVGILGITAGNFRNDKAIIRSANSEYLIRGQSGNFENSSSNSQFLTYGTAVYAIEVLDVPGNLENVGTWQAPIRDYCVDQNIQGSRASDIDFTKPENCGVVNNYSCLCAAQQAPLPVNFKSITATRNKQNVAVKWQTAQEQNNKGFHVQRKTKGDWENIAFIFSAAAGGNSSTDISYAYNDVNTEKGISQYRVMQVDIDGKSKASEIRSVKGEEMAGAKMIVYPNPSMDGKVNVVFEEGNGSRSVVVSDMSGRRVKQYRSVSANTLIIEGLENGVYSIQVTDLNTSAMQVKKIIVKKR